MRPGLRHGTETSYHRGCRCDLCGKAYSLARKRRKAGIKVSQLPKHYDARELLRFFDPDETDITIGARLRVGRRLVAEWRAGQDYLLNSYRADDLANRLGAHPSEVWGDDWWRYADEDERDGLCAID